MADALSPEQTRSILEAIYTGNKIEAIKKYRIATGVDLKDSKTAVEKLSEKLMEQAPERFAKPHRHGDSLATLVFWGGVAALVVYAALKWI
jgi:ribosomal protein L7/L12